MCKVFKIKQHISDISKMIASMQRNLYGKVEELKKIKSFIYVAEVTV